MHELERCYKDKVYNRKVKHLIIQNAKMRRENGKEVIYEEVTSEVVKICWRNLSTYWINQTKIKTRQNKKTLKATNKKKLQAKTHHQKFVEHLRKGKNVDYLQRRNI